MNKHYAVESYGICFTDSTKSNYEFYPTIMFSTSDNKDEMVKYADRLAMTRRSAFGLGLLLIKYAIKSLYYSVFKINISNR